MRLLQGMACVLLLSSIVGCDHFFTKETTGGGGGGTAHVLFAATNPASSNGTLSSFTINNGGTLSSSGNSTTLSVTPRSIAITPNNQFLYVANQTGLIDAFSISGTSVSPVPNTPTVNVGNPVALAVNPAGTLLFALNLNVGSPLITPFRIQSDGELATGTSQALSGANLSVTPSGLAVTPSGTFLYASGGTDTFIFKLGTDTAGNATFTQVTCNAACTIASQAVAVHPNGNFLYVADNASQIAAYSLNSQGVPTLIGVITGLSKPNSLTFDNTSSFLLATTSGDNSLTSYGILQNGSISKVSSITAGSTPVQVSVDPNTNVAFVANSGGSPDISGFAISSSGQLTTAGTANIGGNASAVAITH